MDFNSFFNAIAGQESGGNYSAVNGRTGALGKYQILPGNIGPWSQQYLGHRISTSQFLNSPQLQDRLAGAVLRHYYTAYGARGAAAAWYSGSPSNANNYTRFLANEPSIGEYVDQVMSRVGQAPGRAAPPSQPAVVNVTDNTTQPKTMRELLMTDTGMATSPTGLEAVDKSGAGIDAAQGPQAPQQAGLDAAQGPESPTSTPNQGQGTTNQPDPPTASLTPAPGGLRQAVVELAKQQIGTPYHWGWSTPGKGFDCSGLVQYAMQAAGIKFPRVSYDQLKQGQKVPISQLQPGDLVGMDNGGHVAFYLGNNQILEAPTTGKDVRIRKLGTWGNPYGISLSGIYG